MFEGIKSWRWSRLKSIDAWARCIENPDLKFCCWAMFIISIISLHLGIFDLIMPILLLMLVCGIICEICSATEIIKIGNDGAYAHIYAKDLEGRYLFRVPKRGIEFYICKYDQSLWGKKKRKNLLIQKKECHSKCAWYYFSSDSDSMIYLGRHYRQNVYISEKAKELNIIIGTTVKTFPYDKIIDNEDLIIDNSWEGDKKLSSKFESFAILKDDVLSVFSIAPKSPNLIKYVGRTAMIFINSSLETYVYDNELKYLIASKQ